MDVAEQMQSARTPAGAPPPYRSARTDRTATSSSSASGASESESFGVGPLRVQHVDAHRIARGLGWLSLGLGAVEILFPRTLARLIGAPETVPSLFRAFGVREIASGVLIFNPGLLRAIGLWARVAGDAADIAALSTAFACPDSNKTALKLTIGGLIGVTAVDYLCAQEMSRRVGIVAESGALRVCRSISVNKTPQEAYAFWRELQNLPKFMYHVETVDVMSPERSRWTVKAPAGRTVQWEAEITADQPGQLLSWRSTDGADVANTGTVFFEPRPGSRGTIVRVDLEYRPPGYIAGAAVAALMNRNPSQQIDDDLRRFKQCLETGSLVRSDASPEGTGRIKQLPARPHAHVEGVAA